MPLSKGLVMRWATIAVAAVAVGGIVSGCGSGGGGGALEGAGSNWSTNGGTMSNQRYSTLDDIDTSNVAQLKGVWRTHLNGSGVAAKYSGESQPIVQDGVIYITTGNDDVFAVSVDSGKILWEHKSNIDQEISTICCGWLNRGVAIGDGRVYLGQLDGKVRRTRPEYGRHVVWTRQLVQWQQGQTITGAPLFLDGKIYIGVVGADYGTRGFLEAMDAERATASGASTRSPPRASPGARPGRRTPLRTSSGGASIWSTPAYDEDLNLLYVTTGNAGNDWYRRRPRGRQPLRRVDPRDRPRLRQDEMGLPGGPPRHLGLRLAERAGPVRRREQRRHGEGDRRAREDGLAVPPRPRDREAALRDRREARAAERGTEDREDAAVPAERRVHPAHAADREGDRAGEEPDHRRGEEPSGRRREGDVHAAEHAAHAHLQAGPAGRRQLGAVELQPRDEHVLRLRRRPDGRGRGRPTSEFVEGKSFAGIGAIAGIGYNESSGTLTAIDATDGSVAWQKMWPDACYSGTVTTTGQPRLRRTQQRRPAGVRRHERRPALELPDRRRRERHGRRSSSRTGSSTSRSCRRATR